MLSLIWRAIRAIFGLDRAQEDAKSAGESEVIAKVAVTAEAANERVSQAAVDAPKTVKAVEASLDKGTF